MGEKVSDTHVLSSAIHSIFLESGFVEFDSTPSTSDANCYTISDLTPNEKEIQWVVVKFQMLGSFMVIYGTLSKPKSSVHRVCLDLNGYVPNQLTESQAEFLKLVKDGLALPLMIDMCLECGLPLPPCFISLPSELKVMILECLMGIDVAKMACVCSEMRCLSSNNDLWKQKFEMEFGSEMREVETVVYWKDRFVTEWSRRKRQEKEDENARNPIRRYVHGSFCYTPERRDRSLFGDPSAHIIGGDYDLFPRQGLPFHLSGLRNAAFPPFRLR